MGWIIASILSGLIGIIGIVTTATDQTSDVANPANAFASMFMLALCIVFLTKYRNSKNSVTERKKEEEGMAKLKKVPGSKARINDLGASLCIYAKHMAGLPLAEGTPCHVYLCDDKVIFERNETKYNLLTEKISDIIIKTDKEIQKSYVSSIGGAVGGAVLFGPLGKW